VRSGNRARQDHRFGYQHRVLTMAHRVTAGYVTVETAVPGGRAQVDIPRGADLPPDVRREQVETLLQVGHIESTASHSNADDQSDGRDAFDKADLVRVAEAEGVPIDRRWGAVRIARAIREHRRC